jgi:ribonuclease HI
MPFGMYCYVTMLFGLRNMGATYERCMQHVFGDHIGRTVEVYVDDIVVETRKADDLVSDLRIVFGCLRANEVKLNPEKCVFGMPRRMLLGYIVSQRGIQANPEKVAALERMGPIRDLKGVQKVLGCLAALSRFISRLGEKGLPLYRLLKKQEKFSWTAEAQEALDKLKVTLAHAPILTQPQDSEPQYLYVAATTQVVSAVIVVERTEEGHALPVQWPIYYISEVLSETKARYPQVASLRSGPCAAQAPSLLRGSPGHGGLLLSIGRDHPESGCSGQDCQVVGRADGRNARLRATQSNQVPDLGGLRRRVDGHTVATATDPGRVLDPLLLRVGDEDRRGPAFRLTPRGAHEIRSASPFSMSNNMAKYEALLCGLKIAIDTGIKRLDVRGDSQLVIDQVMKNASYHDDKMEAYCKAVRALEDKFYGIELNHVPCRYNEEADELAKIASRRITVPPNVFARDVAQPFDNLKPSPSSHEEPSGAPSSPTGAEPMDEDPSNEAYVLSLLEGYGADEAEAMDTEPAPSEGD